MNAKENVKAIITHLTILRTLVERADEETGIRGSYQYVPSIERVIKLYHIILNQMGKAS